MSRERAGRLAPHEARRPGPGEHVILSARYEVAFDSRQPPTIEARLPGRGDVARRDTIRLPLSNVTLAGADACRVNGKPHPVRKTEDGFVLTLSPADSAGDESRRDGRATESDQPRQPVEAARPGPKEAAKHVAAPTAPPMPDVDDALRARGSSRSR